jgi:hypothetical protein
MVFSEFKQVTEYWNRSRDLRDAFDVRYIRAISPLKLKSAGFRAIRVVKAYRIYYIDQADEDSSSDIGTVLAEDIRIERLHLRSIVSTSE